MLEQIDPETRPARLILALCTKVKSRPASVADSEASLRRREKEKAEREARLRRDQNGKSNRIMNKFNARNRSFTL